MKKPFINTDKEINHFTKTLSKNKIDRLLNNLTDCYDYKMLKQNIHYLRLKKQFPDFAEFCDYVGF